MSQLAGTKVFLSHFWSKLPKTIPLQEYISSTTRVLSKDHWVIALLGHHLVENVQTILFPRAGNYVVSLKDQLWIHDYDWESCNDRNCDKDQESDDDQKPHNSGCCKSESEKTIESLYST